MTLNEFDVFVQGYEQRVKTQHRMLAWHAALTLQPHTKKGSRLSADKLMGEEDNRTPEEIAADIAARSDAPAHKTDLLPELLRAPKPYVDSGDAINSWIDGLLADAADEADSGVDGDTIDDEVG